MLIDLSMGMIGNNTHISSCWINASTPSFSSHFIKLTDKDNKSFNGNPQDYEKGDEKNPGAVTANSISNKTDYANKKLNVVKAITTNNNNPSSGLGDGRNKYRAVQAACYTGKYAVYAQNKTMVVLKVLAKVEEKLAIWMDLLMIMIVAISLRL